MMWLLKRVTALTVLLFVTASCENRENGCVEEKYTPALVQTFPDSIKAGVTYDVRVQYIIENSCGDSVSFEQQINGPEVMVKAKMHYAGCNCTLEFSETETYFPLKQDVPGTYHYKFYINDTEFDSFWLNVHQ